MNTLIIPCAGRSTRFPGMKPKWMLTHPDGSLMIEKALSGLNTEIFDRIIITIVKAHDEKYEAKTCLKQVFKQDPRVQICVLNDFTSGAAETVYLTLQKMKVTGSFVVKDSDNLVEVKLPRQLSNRIIGLDLRQHPQISNVSGKSFLLISEQGVITDIIEKQIVSNFICLGVYVFEDVSCFKRAYKQMPVIQGSEIYLSHVISYILSKRRQIFLYQEATRYEDWGTLREWLQIQKDCRTYFCDVDGVLMKNSGKYGSFNWYNNREVIAENMEVLRRLQQRGAQIIITTSRSEECRPNLEKILAENGIVPHAIVMGLNHSARVVINDFAPTNPYPSGIAITLPRNSLIKEYLQ